MLHMVQEAASLAEHVLQLVAQAAQTLVSASCQ
jgi:hypothetical protein